MKKTIYIFRHGETNYNAQRRLQGWIDIPLNECGINQAQMLAKNISDIHFDCVYSSPLSRALDTAKIAFADRQIKITTDSGLREWNLGDFSGKVVRLTDAPANTPIDMSSDIIYVPFALISNDDYVPPKGESYNMFTKRVCDTITNIANNTDAETIAIATHGGVAKVFVKSFTDAYWPHSGMPNAGFLKFEYDGKTFTLVDKPDWLAPMVLNDTGKPLVVYHGTYYDFEYFRPLTHFGKEINAKTNLNEGKWKRNPNIDITKPKIIPVNLRDGRWDEIPDLNDHSVQNFMGILFQYMCGDKIADFIHVLGIKNRADFDKKIIVARQKVLNMDIDVPWEFDWICEPVTTNMSPDKIQQELKNETLFDIYTPENLFFQRMILYFESLGLTGFKYSNYTEGPGDMSYINLRQNNIVRTDVILPSYPMPTSNQIKQLNQLRMNFARLHKSRKFTYTEKEMLTGELIGFSKFRFNEIEHRSKKSWAQTCPLKNR